MTHTRPEDDDYVTPREATRALLSVEAFGGEIWEPCAGGGEMADTLRGCGYAKDVFASTLFGDPLGLPKYDVLGGWDFLNTGGVEFPNIITNPPYKIAEKIIEHALSLGPVKAAFLLRVEWLCGQRRYKNFFKDNPPTRVHLFSNRLIMYPRNWTGKRPSGKTYHGWFVWERHRTESTTISWLNSKDFRRDGDVL